MKIEREEDHGKLREYSTTGNTEGNIQNSAKTRQTVNQNTNRDDESIWRVNHLILRPNIYLMACWPAHLASPVVHFAIESVELQLVLPKLSKLLVQLPLLQPRLVLYLSHHRLTVALQH